MEFLLSVNSDYLVDKIHFLVICIFSLHNFITVDNVNNILLCVTCSYGQTISVSVGGVYQEYFALNIYFNEKS